MDLSLLRFPIHHVTHDDIILLRFDVKQVIDGQLQVVSSYIGVVNRHQDVGLRLSGLVE